MLHVRRHIPFELVPIHHELWHVVNRVLEEKSIPVSIGRKFVLLIKCQVIHRIAECEFVARKRAQSASAQHESMKAKV